MFGKVISNAVNFAKDNLNFNTILPMVINKVPRGEGGKALDFVSQTIKGGANKNSLMDSLEDYVCEMNLDGMGKNPRAKEILRDIPIWNALRGVSEEDMPVHGMNLAKEFGKEIDIFK